MLPIRLDTETNEKCVDILNTMESEVENETDYQTGKPFITLYAVITRHCNTFCKFCEYRGNVERIELDKFKRIYEEITKEYTVRAVHFTGGEPALAIELLGKLCAYIKSVDRMTETSINTNGSLLYKANEIEELDSIALSRHHYDDRKNLEIFGVKEHMNSLPTTEMLQRFPNKEKLHISCNLIKGYIDSIEEVEKYLDYCGEIGIAQVGFVGLMPINEYCREHFVDITKMPLSSIPNVTQTKHKQKYKNNQLVCQCENYLYTTKQNTLLSFYYRHANQNKNITNYLVYEQNNIKLGFSGDYLL